MKVSESKRGFIMAVPQKYEDLALANIQKIRAYGCNLPIEIWEIGREISPVCRSKFEAVPNVYFQDVKTYTENDQHWKGFQVKAFMLYHTGFQEICLIDADAVFHQNPEVIFEDENYQKTGAYFFKDLDKWQFKYLTHPLMQWWQKISYKKFYNAGFFNRRKQWLTNLLPEQHTYFPQEWHYIYQPSIPKNPVKEALQESGVVYMDATKHRESIQNIFRLNENHPDTYQYVWGDKETFWIGCVMAGKPFHFNESPGYMSDATKRLSHDYRGQLFFSQKG